jgi:MerR, DNA binding
MSYSSGSESSVGNAPRLGVATWLSAIGTVVGSWLATAGLITVEVMRHWAHPRTIAASCLARLQRTISGDAGMARQITLVVIAAGAAVAAGITGVRLATAVLGMRARAPEIKDILDLHRQGTAPCDQVTVLLDQHISDIDRAIADLQALRASLAAALKAARSDRRRGQVATVCRIIESTDDTAGLSGRGWTVGQPGSFDYRSKSRAPDRSRRAFGGQVGEHLGGRNIV